MISKCVPFYRHSSSSSNSVENNVTRPKNEGAEPVGEPVAIGDGIAAERPRQQTRQPLAPVQSSKKRKRDRPSLDGDEDTVRIAHTCTLLTLSCHYIHENASHWRQGRKRMQMTGEREPKQWTQAFKV